ncbi:MAG: hypothetical protein N2441_02380 [Rhodocyclaceae bacterium]|nr:hypothetical protein [Rhodocyclaceae bacterium]
MRPKAHWPQQGFAIVAAIFLIVALAALAAAMVHFSAAQHVTSATDVMGSRALAAARAGSDWQIATIMAQESDNTPQYQCPPGPANFTFDVFSLVVRCSDSTHDEGGFRVRVYRIESTAKSGGAPGDVGYVERRIDTIIATCRQSAHGPLC